MDERKRTLPLVEWQTLTLIVLDYAAIWLTVSLLAPVSFWLAVPVLAVLIALQSSLQHECLHGHPFRNRALNEALVWLPVGLAIPYGRFRDTHLAHHLDSRLTDPYDDPESNFIDPEVWSRWSPARRRAHLINNTLLGRMLVGPWLSEVALITCDARAIRQGDHSVTLAWVHHVVGVAIVLWLITLTQMPIFAYLVAAYLGLSLLKIRTYLEHRAHEASPMRTVVVEDRGPLSFLFLNNNFHAVHHMHPTVPWYGLPGLYARNRAHYLGRNGAYVYSSYAKIFRTYFLRRKDEPPHPFWRGRGPRT